MLSPIAESPMREHWATTACEPEPPSPTLPTSPLLMPSSSRSDAFECTLNCRACHTPIASQECLLSQKFRGDHGKGALYSRVTNTFCHPPSLFLMNSGAYNVRQLACIGCAAQLGWLLLRAHEPAESWKDGCYLLELGLLYEGMRPRRRPAPLPSAPTSRFSVADTDDTESESDPEPGRRASEDSAHSIWSPDPEADAFQPHPMLPCKTPVTRFTASLDPVPRPPRSSSPGARLSSDSGTRLSTVSRPSGPRTSRHSRLGSAARSTMVM